MAYYINPPSVSKEAWLKQYGKALTEAPKWEDVPFDSLPVCLVENSMFSAAGIAYDRDEYEIFIKPDRRKKQWFIVTKELIIQVEPSIAHLVKLPKKEQH